MAAPPNCPLDPTIFLQWPRPMGNEHLQAIESHLLSGNCQQAHPSLKELVFDGPFTGTTPLLFACNFGELHSVKHIVESWGADFQAPATYYLAPTSSIHATPLFVAALRGHDKIVRFLLEKGAKANVKTSSGNIPEFDGLSPLDGAVSGFWRSPIQLN